MFLEKSRVAILDLMMRSKSCVIYNNTMKIKYEKVSEKMFILFFAEKSENNFDGRRDDHIQLKKDINDEGKVSSLINDRNGNK